jgi:protein-disulfide isomerase
MRTDAMMTKTLTAVAATALLMLASPVAAEEFPVAQKSEIEHIIREYLVSHPEVLQDAIAELEKRQAAADLEKTKAAVASNTDTVFNSSRQVVLGNPAGDVTMVEFFDYNCGYCKRAMTDMLDLMKTDPKLKIILKEFPVLGSGSIEAAKVAVAVRMQDKGGKKYLEFHQKLLGGRGQADKARALAVAKEVGLDMKRIEADMESDEAKVSLEEGHKLGETLGLNGTPSYVVGTDVVVGAVGLDALRSKISTARGG